MTDTPAWLARYEGGATSFNGNAVRWAGTPADPQILLAIACREIDRLNDRIAVLESGQREMETRLPTEGGL